MRDAFALAKEKSPCIIFIDEIDAIGTKRFDSEVSGDREVQRTMLELLNQLDGFSSDDNIKASFLLRCIHPYCTTRYAAGTRQPLCMMLELLRSASRLLAWQQQGGLPALMFMTSG